MSLVSSKIFIMMFVLDRTNLTKEESYLWLYLKGASDQNLVKHYHFVTQYFKLTVSLFSCCVLPYLYCLRTHELGTSQILVLFSHRQHDWKHLILSEWSQSEDPLFSLKPEGLCKCAELYVHTYCMCLCQACVQLCNHFLWLLILSPYEKKSSVSGFYRILRRTKCRGQQASGERLLSCVQQMGEAGLGIAVGFTFSSAHLNPPLESSS